MIATDARRSAPAASFRQWLLDRSGDDRDVARGWLARLRAEPDRAKRKELIVSARRSAAKLSPAKNSRRAARRAERERVRAAALTAPGTETSDKFFAALDREFPGRSCSSRWNRTHDFYREIAFCREARRSPALRAFAFLGKLSRGAEGVDFARLDDGLSVDVRDRSDELVPRVFAEMVTGRRDAIFSDVVLKHAIRATHQADVDAGRVPRGPESSVPAMVSESEPSTVTPAVVDPVVEDAASEAGGPSWLDAHPKFQGRAIRVGWKEAAARLEFEKDIELRRLARTAAADGSVLGLLFVYRVMTGTRKSVVREDVLQYVKGRIRPSPSPRDSGDSAAIAAAAKAIRAERDAS